MRVIGDTATDRDCVFVLVLRKDENMLETFDSKPYVRDSRDDCE